MVAHGSGLALLSLLDQLADALPALVADLLVEFVTALARDLLAAHAADLLVELVTALTGDLLAAFFPPSLPASETVIFPYSGSFGFAIVHLSCARSAEKRGGDRHPSRPES